MKLAGFDQNTGENLSAMFRFGFAVKDVFALSAKNYSYQAVILKVPDLDGAFVPFPYDLRAEVGKGRAKVQATFDGEPYRGSIVNMGHLNPDGSVCYIIGIRKDIRAKIGKQPGDSIAVTIEMLE